MKIDDELKGKDVIDDSGDKLGEISDVDWNPQINKVEYLIVSEGGLLGGKKREIDYNLVKTIGEEVLLKKRSEIKGEEELLSLEEIRRREEEI
ncbi:MAG: PRC-barrel domain-containing protein [Methanobacterium sp.]